jgi:hypothetical protein
MFIYFLHSIVDRVNDAFVSNTILKKRNDAAVGARYLPGRQTVHLATLLFAQ